MRIVTFINNKSETTERATRVGALLDNSNEILDFASAIRGAGNGSDAGISTVNPLAWFDLEGENLKRAREIYDVISNRADGLERERAEGLLIKRASVRLLAPVPRPGKLIA